MGLFGHLMQLGPQGFPELQLNLHVSLRQNAVLRWDVSIWMCLGQERVKLTLLPHGTFGRVHQKVNRLGIRDETGRLQIHCIIAQVIQGMNHLARRLWHRNTTLNAFICNRARKWGSLYRCS